MPLLWLSSWHAVTLPLAGSIAALCSGNSSASVQNEDS